MYSGYSFGVRQLSVFGLTYISIAMFCLEYEDECLLGCLEKSSVLVRGRQILDWSTIDNSNRIATVLYWFCLLMMLVGSVSSSASFRHRWIAVEVGFSKLGAPTAYECRMTARRECNFTARCYVSIDFVVVNVDADASTTCENEYGRSKGIIEN
ncbi:hypothetical protein V6N12_056476 [Hibiscus sabdariffa]|uniref:Uncharacterized protein n=1 Tax=Hibiscus sabdariffa TaxID=183260 RepID=A0ABR2CSM5_9ROSI